MGFITSLKHGMYKTLSSPFKEWINKKFENKDEITKILFKIGINSVDSLVEDIVKEKSHIFNINGKFNMKLVDDFINKIKDELKEQHENLILKHFKASLVKRMNEKKEKE